MRKIFSKIFVGVMIFITGTVMIAGITMDIKNNFKTNYDLPQEDKKINRKINYVKKDCIQKDSLQNYKNKIQNNFIFENRVVLKKLLHNDSLTQKSLKEINIAINVLLEDNHKSAKKLKEIKDLLGRNPEPQNQSTIVEYLK